MSTYSLDLSRSHFICLYDFCFQVARNESDHPIQMSRLRVIHHLQSCSGRSRVTVSPDGRWRSRPIRHLVAVSLTVLRSLSLSRFSTNILNVHISRWSGLMGGFSDRSGRCPTCRLSRPPGRRICPRVRTHSRFSDSVLYARAFLLATRWAAVACLMTLRRTRSRVASRLHELRN